MSQLESEISRLRTETAEDDKHKEETAAKQRELETVTLETEKEFNVSSREYNQKILDLERVKGEKKNFVNSIERVSQSLISLKNSIERRRREIETARTEIEILTGTIEDGEFDLEELS